MKPQTFTPKLYSQYNYDTDKRSNETALHFKDKSRAQAHMLADTDINTIVNRFHKTGVMPQGLVTPTYGDFEGIFDFATATNAIAQANETFEQLPSKLRARFHNNPAEFVDFCSNEANLAEMEKLGLTAPKIQTETTFETQSTPSQKDEKNESKEHAST